jgi:SNF2 family DNA or RNA helicase
MESSSLEERRSINLPRVRVLRISKLEPQKCWDIEVEEASCFFAEGILVHNCKGPYTQNAQLVISLVQQGFCVHGMSATAAEDPTEMRALGFLLGLHSLNKPEKGLSSWYGWMMQHGCYQDDWGGWKLSNRSKLTRIKQAIYGVNANKLTPADFPDSFRNNRVFVEPTEFKDLKKIDKAYEQLGLTPAIIDEYILNGTVANSEHVLVNILKARQLAESFKVPDIVEMAEDFIDGGNSVAIFVNFTDTVNSLCGLLNCPKIDGNQNAAQRQQAIDDFQNDVAHCVVVNIAAGGTGLSLHDIRGERPRISLICPTFNAKDYLQVLGRIHRNGAKSDAVQKVLVAAGTIEEHVMKAIRTKTENLQAIHGS